MQELIENESGEAATVVAPQRAEDSGVFSTFSKDYSTNIMNTPIGVALRAHFLKFGDVFNTPSAYPMRGDL